MGGPSTDLARESGSGVGASRERDAVATTKRSSLRSRLGRLGLLCAMAVVTTNVWIGSPLLGLWVGSRVEGGGPPTMAAFGSVAATIAIVSAALLRLLALITGAYDRLTGRPGTVRRHLPWLRSMRSERDEEHPGQAHISAVEAILIASVMIAVIGFEVWFFFFSTSPIDQRSGR